MNGGILVRGTRVLRTLSVVLRSTSVVVEPLEVEAVVVLGSETGAWSVSCGSYR